MFSGISVLGMFGSTTDTVQTYDIVFGTGIRPSTPSFLFSGSWWVNTVSLCGLVHLRVLRLYPTLRVRSILVISVPCLWFRVVGGTAVFQGPVEPMTLFRFQALKYDVYSLISGSHLFHRFVSLLSVPVLHDFPWLVT